MESKDKKEASIAAAVGVQVGVRPGLLTRVSGAVTAEALPLTSVLEQQRTRKDTKGGR